MKVCCNSQYKTSPMHRHKVQAATWAGGRMRVHVLHCVLRRATCNVQTPTCVHTIEKVAAEAEVRSSQHRNRSLLCGYFIIAIGCLKSISKMGPWIQICDYIHFNAEQDGDYFLKIRYNIYGKYVSHVMSCMRSQQKDKWSCSMCMYLSEKALSEVPLDTGFCQTFCCRHYIIRIVSALQWICRIFMSVITLAPYQLEFSNFDLMFDIWYLILMDQF